MPYELTDIGLPAGWTCWIELEQHSDGACSGKAELRQGHETRCVFVLARQATHDAARARVKLRADHFIDEWMNRPRTGA